MSPTRFCALTKQTCQPTMPWNTNDAERPIACGGQAHSVFVALTCALTFASCSMRVRTMSMKPRADACAQENVGVNLVSIWQPSNCSLSQNHVRPKRKRRDTIRSGQSCPGFQHAYRIKGKNEGKNEGKSRANLEDECGSSAHLHEGGAGPVVLRVGVGGHERRAVSLHRACGQPNR